MRRWPVFSRTAPLLAAGLVQLAASGVAFSTPPAAPVRYDASPAAVVASLEEVVGELADPDPGPSVRVFGDGRVTVHFPHYMRRAGDWTDRLSADELQALLDSLVADGLLDLDPSAARANLAAARGRAREAARRGEAPLLEASDASITTITLAAEGRSRTVVWRGLRADVFAHPDLPEAQQVRRAQETLRALMDRPGLRRER